MKQFQKLWGESLCGRGLVWLTRRGIPALQAAFFASFLWQIWLWVDGHILKSRALGWLFDANRLSALWYDSAFYRGAAWGVRALTRRTPAASLAWSPLWLGAYLAGMILVPDRLWQGFLLPLGFLIPALLYFSHYARTRQGTSFAMAFAFLTLFWGLTALTVPLGALMPLTYLFVSIGFFFLVSYSLRSALDMEALIRCLYLLLLLLCALGCFQQTALGQTARGTLSDGVAFGEAVVLLFPFAFLCPLHVSARPRRLAHIALLLILVFTAVTASQSRAAFVGFSAELALLLLLTDWRYLPLLLLLAPAVTRTAVENIAQMWSQSGVYHGFFGNLFRAFQNFWSNGFGVDRAAFLKVYNAAAHSQGQGTTLAQLAPIPISPVYFTLILEAVALALVVFLWYILRLAHSALTSLVTAPRAYRDYFAAGFSTLAGISVASLLEATLFAPRTLLLYWCVLGLLRAARRIALSHNGL